MPTFGSLFAGIGGIDLGLERAGWTGRWQVEWDDYCQRVLAKHWPDVPRFGDIHDVHGRDACPLANPGRPRVEEPESQHSDLPQRSGDAATTQAGSCPNCLEPVDLIAGGFPCQPFSVAGKQRRLDDDRWLWPEFERAIGELRPRFVLVENVPGLLAGGGMGAVLGGLARLGYDAEWDCIPAAAVGAPHLRYRVFVLAYADRQGQPEQPVDALTRSGLVVPDANGIGWDARSGEFGSGRRGQPADSGRWPLADPDSAGSQGRPIQPERPDQRAAGAGGMEDANCRSVEPRGRGWRTSQASLGDGADWWRVEPDVGRVAHGVPARVDRLRALGNAVVPQVVEVIGRALLEAAA